MIEAIKDEKNILEHIYEEYSSSAESVYYVHDLLKSFLAHLSSTIKLRKKQGHTFDTEGGKQLRKLVLLIHQSAYSKVLEIFRMYEQINQNLWKMTTKASQCINYTSNTIYNIEQDKKHIDNQLKRKKEELRRLENIEGKILKFEYLQETKNMENSIMKEEFCQIGLRPDLYDGQTIAKYLQRAKEDYNKIEALFTQKQINHRNLLESIFQEMKQVEQNLTNFQSLLKNIESLRTVRKIRENCMKNKSGSYDQIFNSQKKEIEVDFVAPFAFKPYDFQSFRSLNQQRKKMVASDLMKKKQQKNACEEELLI